MQATAIATPTLDPQTVTALKQELATATTSTPSAAKAGHDGRSYIPNQILVAGVDATGLANAKELGFEVGWQTGLDTGFYNLTRFDAPPGTDTLTALRTLKVVFPHQIVALNSLYRIYSGANGLEGAPDTAGQPEPCTPKNCRPWQVIGWQEYLRGCSKDVSIGMIDTGLDLSHPALRRGAAADRIITNELLPPGKTSAPTGHGTAVASLLVGDASRGMAGLVPDVKLYSANTFYTENGETVMNTVGLLNALNWMRVNKVKVINMSLTGPDDPLVREAIHQTVTEGAVIVAAAGNDGADAPPAYPAAYKFDNVIAVTAVDANLKPYLRANHGEYIKFAAPGVHIWTAAANGNGGFETGTSFAAPYVTALAATLVLSAEAHGKLAMLESYIPFRDFTRKGKNPVFGNGLALAPASCTIGEEVADLPWKPAPKDTVSLFGLFGAGGDGGQ